ncbi:MAG: hypothetical protein BWK79_17405 [Beggiatoa sp. IS2]|nr:MAG: hypothetical protein BWK79_17405 [Beggiatoa sp. IS2]
MSSNYPDYIDSPTTLPIPPGPYLFRNAQMAVFRLDADYEKLNALCKRYLNTPSERNFNYHPIPFSPSVFLIWIGMDYTSKSKPFGWIHEDEVSFWVPTFAYNKEAILPIPQHIASFIPYLFLDDFYAIALGREVYGFRKLQAQFVKMPQDISKPEFNLNTVAFKTMNSNAVAQMEWLLSVEKVGDAPQPSSTHWHNKQEAHNAIIHWLAEFYGSNVQQHEELLRSIEREHTDLASFFEKLHLVWVFLKQFRDHITSTKACYQAVIEALAMPTQFHSGGLIEGKYQFALNKLASLPIADQLGLSPTREVNGVQFFDLKNFFWLNFDFEVQGR